MKRQEAASAATKHEESKEAVRMFLKQTLELDAGMVIGFSRNAADTTIAFIEWLQVKEKRAKASNLLDNLIK